MKTIFRTLTILAALLVAAAFPAVNAIGDGCLAYYTSCTTTSTLYQDSVTEGDASGTAFQFSLNHAPTSDVVLVVNGAPRTELRSSDDNSWGANTTIIFTPSANTGRYLYVRAFDDGAVNGDIMQVLSLSPLASADANFDGFSDYGTWRFQVYDNDVAPPDADGDGVPDSSDNCVNAANPNQADLDQDGLGDACDTDIDGDGVLNASDNCLLVANANQADLDQDGAGNLCDADYVAPTTTTTTTSTTTSSTTSSTTLSNSTSSSSSTDDVGGGGGGATQSTSMPFLFAFLGVVASLLLMRRRL